MFLSNMQFPYKDPLDMLACIDATGSAWHGQRLLDAPSAPQLGTWSSPKSARKGDICVFMFARSSKNRLRSCVQSLCEQLGVNTLADVGGCTSVQVGAIQRASLSVSEYFGQVVGWAELVSDPVLAVETDGTYGNRVYAEMGPLRKVRPGFSLLSMEPLVKVNRFGGITVLSDDAEQVVSCMLGIEKR